MRIPFILGGDIKGKPKIIAGDGLADALLTIVRPQPSVYWQVFDGWCYHNDTSARTISWRFTDGSNQMNKDGISVAANVFRPIVTQATTYLNSTMGTLWLSNDIYAVVVIDALTAGKLVKYRLLVVEYDGNIQI